MPESRCTPSDAALLSAMRRVAAMALSDGMTHYHQLISRNVAEMTERVELVGDASGATMG